MSAARVKLRITFDAVVGGADLCWTPSSIIKWRASQHVTVVTHCDVGMADQKVHTQSGCVYTDTCQHKSDQVMLVQDIQAGHGRGRHAGQFYTPCGLHAGGGPS